MKRCSKCLTEKALAEFNRYSRSKDGHQPCCRACAAGYFMARRDDIVPMIQARKRERQNDLSRYVRAYLLEHRCVDCGEIDPVVLEFDHVRGEKVASISRMVRKVVPLATLQAEILKCEVRCANCHRRRTARTLGWNALFDDQASVVSASDSAAPF